MPASARMNITAGGNTIKQSWGVSVDNSQHDDAAASHHLQKDDG